mmetsp:Transcript_27729/g.79636  ORF Transcript_27729/g.79636 Transcript_27729/m.79636 type:complete len:422 (+) Transcript_27729:1316-2581(+)
MEDFGKLACEEDGGEVLPLQVGLLPLLVERDAARPIVLVAGLGGQNVKFRRATAGREEDLLHLGEEAHQGREPFLRQILALGHIHGAVFLIPLQHVTEHGWRHNALHKERHARILPAEFLNFLRFQGCLSAGTEEHVLRKRTVVKLHVAELPDRKLPIRPPAFTRARSLFTDRDLVKTQGVAVVPRLRLRALPAIYMECASPAVGIIDHGNTVPLPILERTAHVKATCMTTMHDATTTALVSLVLEDDGISPVCPMSGPCQTEVSVAKAKLPNANVVDLAWHLVPVKIELEDAGELRDGSTNLKDRRLGMARLVQLRSCLWAAWPGNRHELRLRAELGQLKEGWHGQAGWDPQLLRGGILRLQLGHLRSAHQTAQVCDLQRGKQPLGPVGQGNTSWRQEQTSCLGERQEHLAECCLIFDVK